MRTNTHTLELSAPKNKVFGFLSDIENLPKWATQFCKQLKKEKGRHKVVTPQGEIFFRVEGDARTGVIDMFGGPSEDQMAYWPARVVERPGYGSLFIFTAMQYPGVSDVDFARQCDGLRHEFENVKSILER